MYRVFMEGDFGQDRMVFFEKSHAKAWAEQAYAAQMGSEPEEPFEEFWEDLCGIEDLTPWSPKGEPTPLEELAALEAGGVNNWEWYGDSLAPLYEGED